MHKHSQPSDTHSMTTDSPEFLTDPDVLDGQVTIDEAIAEADAAEADTEFEPTPAAAVTAKPVTAVALQYLGDTQSIRSIQQLVGPNQFIVPGSDSPVAASMPGTDTALLLSLEVGGWVAVPVGAWVVGTTILGFRAMPTELLDYYWTR